MTIIKTNPAKLPLEIKRHRKRRHLLLQVTHDAICVKAPYYSSKQEILKFVNSHQQWIAETHAKLPPLLRYQSGDKLLHLGSQKTLKIKQGKTAIHFDEKTIDIRFATTSPQAIAYLLKQTYIKQANDYLSTRFRYLNECFPYRANSLAIKEYKSRWGSCDRHGRIQLSWRLILCPPRAIDYVIIHELCHLKHFDHSKAFWQLVSQHHSTFREDKHWLDKNQALIKISL